MFFDILPDFLWAIRWLSVLWLQISAWNLKSGAFSLRKESPDTLFVPRRRLEKPILISSSWFSCAVARWRSYLMCFALVERMANLTCWVLGLCGTRSDSSKRSYFTQTLYFSRTGFTLFGDIVEHDEKHHRTVCRLDFQPAALQIQPQKLPG